MDEDGYWDVQVPLMNMLNQTEPAIFSNLLLTAFWGILVFSILKHNVT
jgi:hypothetical protein